MAFPLLPVLVIGGAGAAYYAYSAAEKKKGAEKHSPFVRGSHCEKLKGAGKLVVWSEDHLAPAVLAMLTEENRVPPIPDDVCGPGPGVTPECIAAEDEYFLTVIAWSNALTEETVNRVIPAACKDAPTPAYLEIYKGTFLALMIGAIQLGWLEEDEEDFIARVIQPGFDPRIPEHWFDQEPPNGGGGPPNGNGEDPPDPETRTANIAGRARTPGQAFRKVVSPGKIHAVNIIAKRRGATRQRGPIGARKAKGSPRDCPGLESKDGHWVMWCCGPKSEVCTIAPNEENLPGAGAQPPVAWRHLHRAPTARGARAKSRRRAQSLTAVTMGAPKKRVARGAIGGTSEGERRRSRARRRAARQAMGVG